MLEWYLPRDELLDSQDDTPVSELAHQYLGEVVLLGDDPCMYVG